MQQRVKENIDLFISARALPCSYIIRGNNPSADIFVKDSQTGELNEIAKTGIEHNTNDPVWIKAFTIEYLFEVRQELIVKIYDNDESTHQRTFIGEVEVTLSYLCKQEHLELPLLRAKTGGGTVILRADKQAYVNDVFCVTFSAKKILLSGSGFFGKPSPFIVISRMNEKGAFTPVWKSVVISNTDRPTWDKVRIPMTTLCNGDRVCPLKIALFDHDRSGKHKLIGEAKATSVAELQVNNKNIFLINDALKAQKGYVHSGLLSADTLEIEENATFLDYITGGCEISLIPAIDFTASNKEYTDPSSLHYLDARGALNPYQQVISAVGSVLAAYDTDNKYPVLGFGARLIQPDGPVEHCFNVSDTEEVHGVEGILQAYKDRVPTLKFLGPTFLSPLIKEAAHIAAAANCSSAKQKYTVLLILTDGNINDVDATTEAIRNASHKPLSIVIIGVGNADFSTLEALEQCADSDRDIVQFLRFSEYSTQSSTVLAADLLKKVPTQLLEYMTKHSIKPIRAGRT